MKGSKAVVGVFTHIDDTLSAIQVAKEREWDYRVYSPVPHHEIEEATMPDKSPVRFFTFVGAVSGLVGGFGLAIWTSLDYPMRVSAKDVVSVPGFVVIGYECTILLGGIFTLLALILFCKLPNLLRISGYDPRFSQDKFGVVVGCDGSMIEEVKGKLAKAGADEVHVREGL
jgi:hypothetical protein